MSAETEEPRPLTDTEYTSRLAFIVGFLYSALLDVRHSGQLTATQIAKIDASLDQIRPTLVRVYDESFRRPSA